MVVVVVKVVVSKGQQKIEAKNIFITFFFFFWVCVVFIPLTRLVSLSLFQIVFV